MFVELIELLRCPRPHEPAQLVASAHRTDARHIVEGVLGCPVCGAEFPVEAGVARFGAPPRVVTPVQADPGEALRIAAFLELTDARGFALLLGRWGAHVEHLARVSDTPLVLVNPPSPGAVAGAVAGVITTADVVPFTAGAARAAALDTDDPPALVASALAAVRTGGRAIGPVALAVPAGVTELARDAALWVGTKDEAPPSGTETPRLVPLRRAPR